MKLQTAINLQERYSTNQLRQEEFTKTPLPDRLASMLRRYKEAGRLIRIAQTKGKCEECQSEEVTIHHKVMRYKKNEMEIREYYVQRHHYKNLRILCKEHHGVGQHSMKNLESMQTLSRKSIEKIIKKAGV